FENPKASTPTNTTREAASESSRTIEARRTEGRGRVVDAITLAWSVAGGWLAFLKLGPSLRRRSSSSRSGPVMLAPPGRQSPGRAGHEVSARRGGHARA